MKNLLLQLAALFLISNSMPVLSYGQGHVGGGNVKESDLRYLIGMIDRYILTAEGKAAFPEIVYYDSIHIYEESFHALVGKVHPVVFDGPKVNAFQDDRDCIADFTDPNNYHFTCNGNALPEMKIENYISLYRIIFHELLVGAGLENSIFHSVPSQYRISYKITTESHLVTYPAVVLGKSAKERGLIPGIECSLKGRENELILQASRQEGRLILRSARAEMILPLEVDRFYEDEAQEVSGEFLFNHGKIRGRFGASSKDNRDEFYLNDSLQYPLAYAKCKSVGFKDHQFQKEQVDETANIYTKVENAAFLTQMLNWVVAFSKI